MSKGYLNLSESEMELSENRKGEGERKVKSADNPAQMESVD